MSALDSTPDFTAVFRLESWLSLAVARLRRMATWNQPSFSFAFLSIPSTRTVSTMSSSVLIAAGPSSTAWMIWPITLSGPMSSGVRASGLSASGFATGFAPPGVRRSCAGLSHGASSNSGSVRSSISTPSCRLRSDWPVARRLKAKLRSPHRAHL